MHDFSMTHYYREYQDAVTRLSRKNEQLKTLKEKPLYVSDEERPAVYAEIEAAEAERAALQAEADDLWCKANTGRSQEDLEQSRKIVPQGLQPKAHYPATPRGGKLQW